MANQDSEFEVGPLSLLKEACINNTQIMINCRHNRKLLGRVKSFDRHCNMVLDEVTEFWSERTKSKKSINRERYLNKLFLRGDSVILVVSNPNKKDWWKISWNILGHKIWKNVVYGVKFMFVFSPSHFSYLTYDSTFWLSHGHKKPES